MNNTQQPPRQARTWRIRTGTLAMLDEAVERLGIPHSTLVDALLEQILAEEAAGELLVARKPIQWGLEGIYRNR